MRLFQSVTSAVCVLSIFAQSFAFAGGPSSQRNLIQAEVVKYFARVDSGVASDEALKSLITKLTAANVSGAEIKEYLKSQMSSSEELDSRMDRFQVAVAEDSVEDALASVAGMQVDFAKTTGLTWTGCMYAPMGLLVGLFAIMMVSSTSRGQAPGYVMGAIALATGAGIYFVIKSECDR